MTAISSLPERGCAKSTTVLALVFLVASCSASDYARQADRSAERILAQREDDVLGGREQSALRPEEKPAAPENEPAPQPGAETPEELTAPEPRILDLPQSLVVAFVSNRQMMDRKEVLHVQALALASVRHAFAPQLALTLGYLFADLNGLGDTNTGTAG